MEKEKDQCDYCCSRSSSLRINCSKCVPLRSMNICLKCSINVEEIRDHLKEHSMSTYQLIDMSLDDQRTNKWKCEDEIRLIETIETCGLGNWIDVSKKLSKNSIDVEKHFEDIYLSMKTSPFSIYFQSNQQRKILFGENEINKSNRNLQSSSLIYPLMFINNDQQKSLSYMPNRDEYEREYFNECEHHLPTQIHSDDQQLNEFDQDFNQDEQENLGKKLLNRAKLSLLRSYGFVLRRRFQLKHFIRDYALGFSFSTDQKFDLHQIARFLSADQYERLIFNNRKMEQLFNELGCQTSSINNKFNDQFDENRNNIQWNFIDQDQPTNNNNNNNNNKRRTSTKFDQDQLNSSGIRQRSSRSNRTSSTLIEQDQTSNSSDSNILHRTSIEQQKSTKIFIRRSVRRVSSSSSSSSSSESKSESNSIDCSTPEIPSRSSSRSSSSSSSSPCSSSSSSSSSSCCSNENSSLSSIDCCRRLSKKECKDSREDRSSSRSSFNVKIFNQERQTNRRMKSNSMKRTRKRSKTINETNSSNDSTLNSNNEDQLEINPTNSSNDGNHLQIDPFSSMKGKEDQFSLSSRRRTRSPPTSNSIDKFKSNGKFREKKMKSSEKNEEIPSNLLESKKKSKRMLTRQQLTKTKEKSLKTSNFKRRRIQSNEFDQ